MVVLGVEIQKRKIYSICYKSWSRFEKEPNSCSTIKVTSYDEDFIKGDELFIGRDSEPIEIPVRYITSIGLNHGMETKIRILRNRLKEHL